MTSTSHVALARTFKRIYAAARNTEITIEIIEDGVKQSGSQSRDVEAALIELHQKFQTLLNTIQDTEAHVKELELMPSISEQVQVAQDALKMIDMMQRLDYIGLARFLENVSVELYEAGLYELSTYETGLTRLMELQEAVNTVIKTRTKDKDAADI